MSRFFKPITKVLSVTGTVCTGAAVGFATHRIMGAFFNEVKSTARPYMPFEWKDEKDSTHHQSTLIRRST